MTYVEWLRVRGVLKVTAIVFGVLLILAGVLRLWALKLESHDMLSWVHSLETNSTSHVTKLTLPDGTKRLVIDNPNEDVHIVIDDHGYEGKHIEILERSPHKSEHSHTTVSIGPIDVESAPVDHGTLTTIDTNRPEDFAYYAAIAAFVALVIATVLGAPFARENDGHLEIAFTKPISREAFSLATIGVDALGIAASWVMTIVFLALAHSLFQAPHFAFGRYAGEVVALGALGVAAWYAMLCAATTSMKRAYGVILGLAWPVALLVALLANLDLGNSLLGQVVHAIATPLGWIDPFSYVHFGPAYVENGQPAGSMALSPGRELPSLLILTLAYGALAVWQWRRVEA